MTDIEKIEEGVIADMPDLVDKDLEEDTDEDALKKSSVADEDDDDEALFTKEVQAKILLAFKYTLLLLLFIFLIAAFAYDFKLARPFFVVVMIVILWNLINFAMNKFKPFESSFEKPLDDLTMDMLQKIDTDYKYFGGVSGILVIIMIIIIAVEVRDARNLISLLGLFVFIALTWLFSFKPRKVKVRPVLFSLFVQFIFGYIVITTKWGFSAVDFISTNTLILLGYTDAGSSFVFGYLSDTSMRGFNFVTTSDSGFFNLGPPLIFAILPTVIFFSSIIQVGYYLRIFPWIISKIGYFLGVLMGTSASETLSAVANIFVGQTEAPLVVAPFMKTMTDSELHAVMTGGFATIAGGVFGVYAFFLGDATAILAASIMSAPAALAISKISLPETEESETAVEKKGSYEIPDSDDVNIIHAATNGAVTGTQLFINIAGNLVAALAIIAMLDDLIAFSGKRIGWTLSFTIICEYIFWPVAWLMGVDPADCKAVGALLGYKIFANEFVAYEMLAFTYRDLISERSFYIASYALCGFANFGSIGIQLGAFCSLAPNKSKNLAKLAFSAMIAGNTACLMTACIAGIFYKGN